ncbi:uncharacterized protein LOC117301552 [Asterias rubens]|uniref:uncharacterized protein LOC117301552 n=1 Tax=Asterias rubens TaxID=7604 RepID=UPI0014558AE1|nr:uncharacterized protein LOC117301552 [Asterias rubens]
MHNGTSKYQGYIGCVVPLKLTIDPRPYFQSYYVVDKCLTDWPTGTVKDRCENITLYGQERFLGVFVTGPDEVTFKNIYCALCHGFERSQLISWSIKLWRCKLVPNTNKWDYNSCKGNDVVPPASLQFNPHRCFSTVSSCTENSTMELCSQKTARIFNQATGLVYKNIDCLDCNGPYNENHFSCNMHAFHHYHTHMVESNQMFTLLFDFTEGTVHSIHTTGIFSKETTGPFLLRRNCSNWQTHDPFLDACVNLCDPLLQPGDEQDHLQCERGINDAMVLDNNQTEYCMKNLTPLVVSGKPTYLEGTSDRFGQQGSILVIYTNFVYAEYIQDAMDQLLTNITDLDQFETVTCNATSVVLAVSVRLGDEMVQCEGYAIESFNPKSDILQSEGFFCVNLSGFVYHQNEFMYEMQYRFALNESISLKDPPVLRLCSPFVGSRRCSLLTFDREEFQWSSGSPDGSIIHYASGRILDLQEIWQLPDGTIRVCNFFEDVLKTEHPAWRFVLAKVSFVNGVLSLVALILALLSYAVFPILRTTAGKTIMNLMVAFVLAQVLLMIGKIGLSWLCILRALMLHWSWLTVFFWMTILACDLAYNLRSNLVPRSRSHRSGGYKLLILGIYGWGTPVVIVASCFIVSRLGEDHPSWLQYGGADCWIVDPFHSLLVFGIPVAFHLAINCLMFGFMLYTIMANQNRLAKARMAKSLRSNVLLNLKLVVITGVTWTLFILANLIEGAFIWYLSVVVNSFQGLFIGLVFLLNENVRNLWRQKLRQIHCCKCSRLHSSKPDMTSVERGRRDTEMTPIDMLNNQQTEAMSKIAATATATATATFPCHHALKYRPSSTTSLATEVHVAIAVGANSDTAPVSQ